MLALELALCALALDSNAHVLELWVFPVVLSVSVAPSGDVSDTAQFFAVVALAPALVSDVFALPALVADALALFALLVALVAAAVALFFAAVAEDAALVAELLAAVADLLALAALVFADDA